MHRLHDFCFVDFRQAVDIVVAPFDAEILSEVDDFHMVWDGMLFQKRLALAMTEAEEHYIYVFKGHLVGEAKVSLAN